MNIIRQFKYTSWTVALAILSQANVAAQVVSLKDVPVPPVAGIEQYISNPAMAVVLGKALFWDMQAGHNSQACASCHYHAGADIRDRNTLNPGQAGGDNIFDTMASGAPGGPNYALTAVDFPFHQLFNPLDRNSTVLHDSNDVVGSQGIVLQSTDPVQESVTPGGYLSGYECNLEIDSIFHIGGLNTHQVTGRNTPTVINAAFNFRNFWDGRANNIFNGADPFGPRSAVLSPGPMILVSNPGGGVTQQIVRLTNSSLASQAVGPPLSDVEMNCVGRLFTTLGQKLTNPALLALQLQEVDPTDSVLGPWVAASGKGLSVSYDFLIRSAFAANLWDDPSLHNSLTQMQANFSLFWGLAIQAYEATLISDDSPFDQFKEGDLSAMTAEQIAGMEVFIGPPEGEGAPLGPGNAACAECHIMPETTGAVFRALFAPDPLEQEAGGVIEVMMAGDPAAGGQFGAHYDSGFYNIGVRPTIEDIGIGAFDPFGLPLSFSKLSESLGTTLIQTLLGIDLCAISFTCEVPLGARLDVDGAFKVPTLRNVELTGPYFHNGGTATLGQVVEFYNRGGDRIDFASGGDSTGLPPLHRSNLGPNITMLNLPASEKQAIVAFMTALTDERVRQEMAPFDHPQLFITNGHQGDGSVVGANGASADRIIERPAVGIAGRPVKGLPPLGGFLEMVFVDSDQDGRIDIEDNCSVLPNGPLAGEPGQTAQVDTDGDGYGNRCDPDLNNDGIVNFGDFSLFRGAWLSSNANADFNGDGVVNFGDFSIFIGFWLQPPGPSGIVP